MCSGRRRGLAWLGVVLAAWGATAACQFPDYDLNPSRTSGGSSEAAGNDPGGHQSLAGAMPSGGAGSGGGSAGTSGGTTPNGGAETGGAGAPSNPGSVFTDDFEMGTANWLEVAGNPWSVAADGATNSQAYRLTPIFAGLYLSASTAGPWQDQIIEADVKVLSFGGTAITDVVSLIGRFSDSGNFYAAALRPDGRAVIRAAVGGGNATTIKTTAALGLAQGVWYRLRFELIGTDLRLFIDGNLAAEIGDNRLSAGKVALGGNNSSATFDNVSVVVPSTNL